MTVWFLERAALNLPFLPSIVLGMVNGQTTTLNKANKNSESLRTTVPSGIIKQFGLEEGDRLDWKLEPRNNDLVVVVKPQKK